MRGKSTGRLFLASTFILAFAVCAFSQIQGVPAAREYFPGDFVHVIVDAPVDTAQINAAMPDGSVVSLVQERRRTLWRGIWQVPLDFGAGTFTAKLNAIDVEGNVFEGESDSFVIKELALVTLVGKPTREAAPTAPIRQIITVEAPLPGGLEERKIVPQPAAGPPPELEPEEKTQLVERNMIAGKGSLAEGRYSEAASFFRVALYLQPKHKEASLYLIQAQAEAEKDKKEKAEAARRQFVTNLLGIVFLVLVGVAILLITAIIRRRLPPVPAAPTPAAKVLSPEERQKRWLQKLGWTKDPFSLDIFEKIFKGDNRLEFDGFRSFLKSRIEEAGGRGLGPFSGPALDEIYAISKGRPKQAVKICRFAVDRALDKGEDVITAEMIKGYEEVGSAVILIADDEEVIRTTLDGILRLGGGYKTAVATDGEEAIKKINENTYDLVLLDVAMPKIDGYEVLKQVRAKFPQLPVVFVTGRGVPQKTVESISQYNLTAYIEKPFTPEKVLDVVARAIRGR